MVPLLGYVAVLVWLTWPLPRVCLDHLPDPTQLIGGIGWAYVSDIDFTTWVLAWDAHALGTSPGHLFQGNVLYPAPDVLAYSEHFLGHMPVALPVYLATGNSVVTFNAVLLASYLGCALAMYALAWRWTGSRAAAFGAGLVYAFNPWRLAPSFSLQVIGAGYLPLLPLLLERWAERRRGLDLAALGLCLLLQTLCSYYLGYTAFIVCALCAAVLFGRGKLRGRAIAGAAAMAAVVVGLVAWVSVPYLRLSAAGAISAIDLGAAQLASLRPELVGPRGQWFPGWVAVGLGVLGVLARPERRGARLLAVILLAAGLVIAAGPYVIVGGRRIPLPYEWVYTLVPGFAVVRFPVRFLSLAELGLAALVGLGVAALGAPRRRMVLVGIVQALAIAALLAECRTFARMAVRPMPIGDRLPSIYRALRDAPEDGVVLELPLGGGIDPRGNYRATSYMLFSTCHWKRLVNGYSGYLPPSHDLLAGTARRLPDPEALHDLVDLVDLRWIVVHGDSGAWAAAERAGDVRRLVEDGQDVLFEVRMPRRRDLVGPLRAGVLGVPATTLAGTPLTPLPRGALRAAWSFGPRPDRVQPAQVLTFDVTVRNVGPFTWPGWGVRPDGLVVVDLRWAGPDGPAADAPGPTLRLTRDLDPHQAATMVAVVRAPRQPGRYWLEARLRQVGGDGAGGEPERFPLTVAAPGSH